MSNRSFNKIKALIIPELVQLIVVDSFCGAGGFTEGVEQAVDEKGHRLAVVVAGINHDALAIASHAENHPETVHFVEDIRDQKLPRKILAVVKKARKLYPNARLLFHASLECFPAGTMILTSTGLKPIEEVASGDLVLTHKGNWKPVTTTMSKVADTVILKGQGHPGLETTNEHPFYARKQSRVWKNDIRRWEYKVMGEPDWVKSEDLAGTQKYRWATPVNAEILPIPEIGGRGMDLSNPDFWWMVGRWLGDGLSAPNRGGQISIVCGNHEVEELEIKLSGFTPESLRAKNSELRWQHRKLRTASIFYCSHMHFSYWLIENFGRLSHGKTIPAWALTMPPKFRQALLDGYISADGHKANKRTQATSVSKRLALGIRLLAESLGHRCSLHEYESHNSVIEGRTVKVRNQWVVAWDNNKSDRGAFQDDLHAWSLVKEKTEGRKNQLVYNLSVEDDESYVADGIVVHNCTNFSNAKGGKPRDADSRSLAEFMPYYLEVLQPDLFTVENVREFMSWGPLNEEGKPEDRKRGKDYVRWYQGIEAMGYRYDYRLHNTADFGANTSRTRYFAQFVRDGMPLVWPEPTHAKNPARSDLFSPSLEKWKPIRDCLQLEDKGKSIFRNPPLSDKTYERIFEGLVRHVGNGDRAFLSKYFTGTGMSYSTDQPASTITAVDHNALVSVEPFMARLFATASNGHGTYPATQPATTITTADGHAMVTPEPFISKYFSGKPQSKNYGIDEPGHCITTVDGQAIISPEPFAMTYNSGSPENRVKSLDEPAQTLLTENTIALVSPKAFCIKYHSTGHNTFADDQPCSTIPTNDSVGIVQAEQFINLCYTQGKREQSIEDASAALTTVPKHQLVSALFVDQQYGKSKPASIDSPAPCLTVNPHYALVEAFVADPQWGGHSHSIDKPSHTIIARQDKAPASLVSPEWLLTNIHKNAGTSLDEPSPTLLTGTHHYVMSTNFTNVGIDLESPSPTVTADRHWSYLMTAEKGLQPVILVYESDSEIIRKIKAFMAEYGIVDILMRMLKVAELKLIQGFPANYVLLGSQTHQKKFIGNSVPPPYVKAWMTAIGMALKPIPV